MLHPRIAHLFAFFAFLPAAAHAQGVVVVDASGGGAFTDLQNAVDDAHPGDTILVRPGQYDDVVINKGLSVVSDTGGVVAIDGSVSVVNLPAGESVHLHGLFAGGTPNQLNPFPPPLTVRDCLGTVWVEDCGFLGNLTFGGAGYEAVRVTDSTAVVLQDTSAQASGVAGSADGLVVVRSTVYAFGCTFAGGTSNPNDVGGDGVFMVEASVYLNDCVVTGGVGQDAGQLCPLFVAGDGGDGVKASGATSVLRTLATAITAGAGGAAFSTCGPGQAGLPVRVLGGAYAPDVATRAYGLEASPVARWGESFDYTITGPAGDVVWLAFSTAPAPVYLPGLRAPILLQFSGFTAVNLGALPPSGTLVIPTTVPVLTGLPVVTLYAQVLGISQAEGLVGGESQVLTWLDSSL